MFFRQFWDLIRRLEAVDGLLQLLAGRRASPHRRFKIIK